jgi:hypothetical protein
MLIEKAAFWCYRIQMFAQYLCTDANIVALLVREASNRQLREPTAFVIAAPPD